MMPKKKRYFFSVIEEGHTTDFKQSISSIQIDHVAVNEAKKGQEIGLLVGSRVRQHDMVYKV
jgi:putative protease